MVWGMRVVVTGGAGYVGSALVSCLFGRGYEILSLDNLSRGDYGVLDDYRDDPRLRVVVADIRDRRRLEEVIRDFGVSETIFHLAAMPGLKLCRENPGEAIEVNVLGTFNVLEVARRLDIRRVIFASSAAVYGVPLKLPVNEEHRLRPVNLYGVTKLAGENLMSLYHDVYGLETVVLRFGNIYGVGLFTRWETVIPRFVKLALEGKPLTIYGDGGSSRDFVHVWDIVEALRLSAEAEAGKVSGEVFNVGGEAVTVRDIAKIVMEEVKEYVGRGVEVVHLPPRVGETRELRYSMEKIKKRLGFSSKWTIRRGVKQLIEYYLNQCGGSRAVLN